MTQGRKSKFAHYVAGLSFFAPVDMLAHFHADLIDSAALVDASVEGVDIQIDGKRHYLRNLKGDDDQRQYYIASLITDADETVWPAVTFGSFKSKYDNVYFKPRDLVWRSFESDKDSVVIDLERRKAYQEKLADVRRDAKRQELEREQQRRDAQDAAGQAAAYAWQHAVAIVPEESHPYLIAKGLRPHGNIRVAPYRLTARLFSHNNQEWYESATLVEAGDLLIPVYSSDPAMPGLINLQRISSDGKTKRFIMGGAKKSGYMPLMPDGWAKGQSLDAIVTGEGYATCASLIEASIGDGLKVAVVVAFDCGNIETVATAMMDKYPGVPVINAADNDTKTKGNPGLANAKRLKEEHGIPFVAPTFDDGEPGSDWDDFRQVSGIDAMRRVWAEQMPAAIHYSRTYNDPEYQEQVGRGDDAVAEVFLSIAGDKVPEFGWPEPDDKGRPLDTLQNLEWMLNHYGIKPRYNKVLKDVEIAIPGMSFSRDNAGNVSLAYLQTLCARNRLARGSMDPYIKAIAEKNAYDPVMDWVKSKPWDGTDRTKALVETITVADGYDPELRNMLVLRWLISCMGALHNDGTNFWSKGVLVFAGDQNLGKTSWFRALLPASSGLAHCIQDGLYLDPSDKDSLTTAVSHWLVELGELDATFRKSDIARLKAFVTRQTDKLRRPYDRKDSDYPRRTIFFASVNEPQFLQDSTGNSRWWTIEVKKLNHLHGIDMQQLWAQVLTAYESGERHYLTPAEEAWLAGSNAQYEQIDPIEEMILRGFNIEVKYRDRQVPEYVYSASQWMTATEALIAVGIDKPSRSQSTTAGTFLRKITGGKPKRSNKGSTYYLPTTRLLPEHERRFGTY